VTPTTSVLSNPAVQQSRPKLLILPVLGYLYMSYLNCKLQILCPSSRVLLWQDLNTSNKFVNYLAHFKYTLQCIPLATYFLCMLSFVQPTSLYVMEIMRMKNDTCRI